MPGVDMSTVVVDELEAFDVSPVLDVESSGAPYYEVLSKAIASDMVTERREMDPEAYL
jgi:hypothetical protein